MKQPNTDTFVKTVYAYYREHGRHDLPWRMPALTLRKDNTLDPYKIMVSELMLQQTQVDRVIPKYTAFLKAFPSARTLARAPLGEVLAAWSGLGYNRRARFLKRASETIVTKHKGIFPREKNMLMDLPGIGKYTAGAIRAFAFNEPDAFLETNIRAAYIHFFFSKRKSVDDTELLRIVEKTIDNKKPREWYAALMDYGSYLKSQVKNPTRQSAGYKRQSTFAGSIRQVRGNMLKYMIKNGLLTFADVSFIESDDQKTNAALTGLIKDGMVKKVKNGYRLAA